jgi:hypothetical protein
MSKRIQYGITLSSHDSVLLERKAERDGIAPSKLAGQLVSKALRRQLGPVPKPVAAPKPIATPAIVTALVPSVAAPAPAPAPPSLPPASAGVVQSLRPEVPTIPVVEANAVVLKPIPKMNVITIRIPDVMLKAMTLLAIESKLSTEKVAVDLIATFLGITTKESALLSINGELEVSDQIKVLQGIGAATLKPLLTNEEYWAGVYTQFAAQETAKVPA